MVGTLKHAAPYANASHEELLERLESLLEESNKYSIEVARLQTEVALQRVNGFNSGYNRGW